MSSRVELPRVAAIGIWLTAVIGFGLLAMAILGALYQGFLNCDVNVVADSANTGTGWLIAVVAVLLPLSVLGAVAAARDRKVLLAIGLVAAAIEIGLWWWILNPAC